MQGTWHDKLCVALFFRRYFCTVTKDLNHMRLHHPEEDAPLA
jgi:hypothetical protein